MESIIPLPMFLELVFNALFPKHVEFTVRPLEDVTNDMLRFIRKSVSGQTFRYLVEHGMTAEYCEQWLQQKDKGVA